MFLAALGRAGDAIFVNAANGNLIVNNRDEILIGRGPDAFISRTYNSLGQFTDDNGDNSHFGIQRRLHSPTGAINAIGATVTRTGADGSDIVYTYDVSKGAYFAKDGAGAYDRIQNFGHWTWTDGDSAATEGYDIDGNLISSVDTDGNITNYQYTVYNNAYRLLRVNTSGGEKIEFNWNGNNLTSLVTSYTACSPSSPMAQLGTSINRVI